MSAQYKVTFQGLDPSAAFDVCVREWVARLEAINGRISRCEVVIDRPHRHHLHGSAFEVHVSVELPHGQIIGAGSSEDPYVAARDAFRAARRQLVQRTAA